MDNITGQPLIFGYFNPLATDGGFVIGYKGEKFVDRNLSWAFIQIRTRSDFYGELSYHNSNPSWSFNVNDQLTGKVKTLEQIFDMSGMAFKFGFKFLW